MKETQKKVVKLGYIVLALFVMLTFVSYAWMTISSTPTVTDLAISIVSDNNLEVAKNVNGKPGEWSTIIDLSNGSELTVPIVPVTFVASETSFYEPNFGFDGRITSVDSKIDINSSSLSYAGEAGTSEDGDYAYLYVADFWIRTQSDDCVISLADAMEREDGQMGAGTFLVSQPDWDDSTSEHTDVGGSAQNAIRVAFVVDPTDEEGGTYSDAQWYLWEPSYEEEKEKTESINGETYEGDIKLIRQKPSTWLDSSPALRDSIQYTAGEFVDENTELFSLRRDKARHVTLYLWIEGQDVDCVNSIFGGTTEIFANIQFTAKLRGSDSVRPD